MTEGTTMAVAAEPMGAGGQALARALAMRTQRREDRHANTPHNVPRDRAALMRATTEARGALLEAAFAARSAAIRARAVADVLDEALDEALVVLADAQSTPARALPAATGAHRETIALSPREMDVLALVAEGHSNKAIADALFISPNTVKTHVGSLLRKLHASTRAQLAAMVAGEAFRERPAPATRQG